MLDDVVKYLTSGMGQIGVVILAFWKADDLLSEAGRKQIFEALQGNTRSSFAAVSIMERYFSAALPAALFLWNTLVFTVAAVLVLLLFYISITPGLWGSLLHDPYARFQFLRQVFGNGLVVVFVANYIGFTVFAKFHRESRWPPLAVLALDIALRLVIFTLTTAATYVIFAEVGGAFRGDDWMALQAVLPTLRGAATFQNLTGVYLYACAISSLPLFVAACIDVMQRNAAVANAIRSFFFFLPFKDRPMRSVAFVLGVFVALFAFLVSVVFALL
jgi:hypothetical protein